MIILIVDQLDVGPNEAKGDPPIAVDPDRPMPVQITLQRVKFERRQVHVRRCGGDIEQTKDVPNLLGVSVAHGGWRWRLWMAPAARGGK